MVLVRVAIIDSGINPAHPHVQPVAGGIRLTEDGTDTEYLDVLGHGTAVAGAIREKAPAAELFAVKVFDRTLVTSGSFILRAIDWCLEHEMNLVNLSLGTLNSAYVAGFIERVERAARLGTRIIAAYEMGGQRAFPGSLPGVVGVLVDEACPREEYRRAERPGNTVYVASGYPRAIPGVPPARNLQGISFAVANVTGFLAAGVEPC